MLKPAPPNRRRFLKATAAVVALSGFPTIIPASALGRDGMLSPSNRTTLAVIGTGNQGFNDIRSFLGDERVAGRFTRMGDSPGVV